MTSTPDYRLTHVQALEAESLHIFREVAAELERPALMFSGGKDSIVMLRLAEKAFWPARIPFPILHVDTGLNFPEVIAFRDKRVEELGVELIVASVPDAIERGLVRPEPNGSRSRIQTPVLLGAVGRHRFTALQASWRSGLLDCELNGDRVILGGHAVTVIEGHFQI